MILSRRGFWPSFFRIVAALTFILGVLAILARQPVWAEHTRSAAGVSPEQLQAHVRFLSVECAPRHYLAHENQNKARDYILEHLQRAGARVELQDFPTAAGSYQNVVAHFGPADGPRYVIGAHFDACGARPGADDNASGVAGLLELAVLLGREKSLPAPFELVAYNLEEPPFFASPDMGSAVHARHLHEMGIPVALMVSLEMIGYFKDERGSQSYPGPMLSLFYPSRGNFIAIVGRWDQRAVVRNFKSACVGMADIPVVSLAAPSFVPAVDFSDHRNYWDEGDAALMITDTAFLRNHNYHQMTDTFDTLDYRRMAEVVRMLHAGLIEYARHQR